MIVIVDGSVSATTLYAAIAHAAEALVDSAYKVLEAERELRDLRRLYVDWEPAPRSMGRELRGFRPVALSRRQADHRRHPSWAKRKRRK